jgi:hypothetical protein
VTEFFVICSLGHPARLKRLTLAYMLGRFKIVSNSVFASPTEHQGKPLSNILHLIAGACTDCNLPGFQDQIPDAFPPLPRRKLWRWL